jgi:hypothetical protein
VRETDEEIVVTIDLSGSEEGGDRPPSVGGPPLAIRPHQLRREGEQDLHEGRDCYRLHLELPEPINVDSASSTYRNGVLEVRMRKKRSGYRIPIE